jgi:hypothetical protein
MKGMDLAVFLKDGWRKIASLTMSAVSSTFAHTTARTRRRAPFRSRGKYADPTKARSQSSFRSGTQSDPCISSVHNLDHDYYFELLGEEEQDAQSITRCSSAHHRDFRAVLRANRTF